MNKIVNKQALAFGILFSILTFTSTSSCVTYEPIKIQKRINYQKLRRHVIQPADDQGKTPAAITKKEKYIRVCIIKYFALLSGSNPVSRINNRAVQLSLKGEYIQAEILFKEAIKEDKKTAAFYNNLGIVYEVFNQREKAFAMYTKACILEPGNVYFRKNYLSFEESRSP